MKDFSHLRNIFVAMTLSLSVCLNSSSTIAKTTTTTAAAITADTPNNCTNCPKKQHPYSFKHKMKTKVPLREVNSEYAYNKFLKRKNPYLDFSFYVGIASEFKSNMDTSGVWETLPNGDRVWRMQLHSDSDWLKGIGVQTTELILPEGCTLFFYSPDKKQLVGPVLPADPLGSRQRMVNTIAGKDICIEYYEPKAQKGKGLFNIDFLLYRLNDFPYSSTHRLKKTVPIASPYSKWRNDIIINENKDIPKGQLSSAEKGTNYTLDNSGVWETLPNGDRIWRLGIRSELGYGISLWTKIVIPKGGYFAYYSPDGYYVSSLYTAPGNSYNDDLFTGEMPGKELIVEYYEPKNAKGKGNIQVLRVELNLTKWHTTALERGDREEQDLGEPTCSPNVVCHCDEFIDTVTTTPTFCGTSLLDLPETLKHSVVRIHPYLLAQHPLPPSIAFLQKKAIFFCAQRNKDQQKHLT
ncbi:MAG: hypothetical protein JNM36_03540 [Chitinophagales bacterium]|nr:hypothetical protein [Chitinophagales bacterium]